MFFTSTEDTYRLDELGWLQFQQLCTELLAEAGLPREAWDGDADKIRTARLHERLVSSVGTFDAPALLAVVWRRPGTRRPRVRAWATEESVRQPVVVLSNAEASALGLEHSKIELIGLAQIGAALDALPQVRRRVPFVLGVRNLAGLVDSAVADRSTADIAAAAELARIFVPTNAYRHTLDVLDRLGFAVLTGPPEMGKTAIARTIALAALTDGWEAHECTHPDELRRLYARDRCQIFVADDAFGSTEYRPDAAERWAVELDRVLRAMDANHHLLWTSRPAPLRTALRRIHREHGVERWPQPAEIQVDASALAVGEKTLILFRHARAARLSDEAASIVRTYGADIVGHEHFTPERIRRFAAHRLGDLVGKGPGDVSWAIAREIREPTKAMAASFAALPDELRALLVALVDSPPGPVRESDLAASLRRHSDGGLPCAPGELVDRLTDHFVRIIPPDRVAWVHPSWRDLVIEGIASDQAARTGFLGRCSIDGLLLALSTGGGAAGERDLPLLVEDADWDVVGGRLHGLTPTLDDHDAVRLLLALREAIRWARGTQRAELGAIALNVLLGLKRSWDAARLPIPAALLAGWVELAPFTADKPRLPDMTATWIEALPTTSADLRNREDLRRLDEWIALVELLSVQNPEALSRGFGFPRAQERALRSAIRSVEALALSGAEDDYREAVRIVLAKLTFSCPMVANEAYEVMAALRKSHEAERDWWEPDLGPPQPVPVPPAARGSIVSRILRDLRAA
jgi:hypothetical protein